MTYTHPLLDAHSSVRYGRISLSLLDRDWTLCRPADLESLWDGIVESEFAHDERLPYWVELWPSSLALAQSLADNKERFHGKRCLDLGCGLGFTAIIGSWLGAWVTGMDYEFAALRYARKNARINGGPKPRFLAMDWRSPGIIPGSFSCIWGGDIMYESRFAAPIKSFLDYALAPDGIVWMAEPGRAVFAEFQQSLLRQGWRARIAERRMVKALHEQPAPVSVNIWELSRS